MKLLHLFGLLAALFLVSGFSGAEELSLEKLVPQAKGYEIIYKFNPLIYSTETDYEINNAAKLSKKLKRIGYFLMLKGADGKETWAFASMDAFSQDIRKIGVPSTETGVIQTYVNNLEVAGNAEGLKTGKFDKGCIEFWCCNYGPANVADIPGADGEKLDFGDQPFGDGTTKGHGCMQIHNYQQMQTIIAYNAVGGKEYCELGIGNNPKGNPDWTLSGSGKTFTSAVLIVAGQFE